MSGQNPYKPEVFKRPKEEDVPINLSIDDYIFQKIEKGEVIMPQPSKHALRYIHYDRETKPVFFGWMDNVPWTYYRLCETYAWIKYTSMPIVIGVNAEGFMSEVQPLSNTLFHLGVNEEERNWIIGMYVNGDVERADKVLSEKVEEHQNNVVETLQIEDKMRKLELMAKVAEACAINSKFEELVTEQLPSGYLLYKENEKLDKNVTKE